MASIEFVVPSSEAYEPAVSFADPDRAQIPEADAEAGIRLWARHAGDADTPQLLQVRYPPATTATAHAHEADEIIFVTEGELIFGRRHYGPGSSVHIPRETLYSFRAGAEGATFLNFRPYRDDSVLSAAQVRDRRARRRDRSRAAFRASAR